MINELEGSWKEAVLIKFNGYSLHLSRGTEEISVRVAYLEAEIWTPDFSSVKTRPRSSVSYHFLNLSAFITNVIALILFNV